MEAAVQRYLEAEEKLEINSEERTEVVVGKQEEV